MSGRRCGDGQGRHDTDGAGGHRPLQDAAIGLQGPQEALHRHAGLGTECVGVGETSPSWIYIQPSPQ
eukprot:39184-Eustigmatos_ZCMA.PRE.1